MGCNLTSTNHIYFMMSWNMTVEVSHHTHNLDFGNWSYSYTQLCGPDQIKKCCLMSNMLLLFTLGWPWVNAGGLTETFAIWIPGSYITSTREQENGYSEYEFFKSVNQFTQGLFPQIDTWRHQDIISLMLVPGLSSSAVSSLSWDLARPPGTPL